MRNECMNRFCHYSFLFSLHSFLTSPHSLLIYWQASQASGFSSEQATACTGV